MMRSLNSLATGLTLIFVLGEPGYATTWEKIESQAQGQTVYFYAWGGSPTINAYIEKWGKLIEDQFNVQLNHVKVDDISSTIQTIQTAKRLGRNQSGNVDLLWINGENFARMKREGLLGQPFAKAIPAAEQINWNDPSILLDFSIPTEGLEAPWGRAQLVFIHDTQSLTTPPRSMLELFKWARQNVGRMTYPEPPNFHGTTFLKQVLLELTSKPEWLQEPFQRSRFDDVTQSMWEFLDALHPYLWRQGREFPDSAEVIMDLFANGSLDLALSFNPNDASQRILDGRFSESVRTHIHRVGTVGNTHFLAIPFNAKAREGALVTVNALLGARAQADKANPEVWGDPTVLDMSRLSDEDRAYFEAVPLASATLSPEQLGTPLPEPHASWVEPIETEWKARYFGSYK